MRRRRSFAILACAGELRGAYVALVRHQHAHPHAAFPRIVQRSPRRPVWDEVAVADDDVVPRCEDRIQVALPDATSLGGLVAGQDGDRTMGVGQVEEREW